MAKNKFITSFFWIIIALAILAVLADMIKPPLGPDQAADQKGPAVPAENLPQVVTNKNRYFLVLESVSGQARTYQASDVFTGENKNIFVPKDARISFKKYMSEIKPGAALEVVEYLDNGQTIVANVVNVYQTLPKDKIPNNDTPSQQ